MARLTRSEMEAALAFAAEVGTAASQVDRADYRMLESIAGMLGSERAAYDQVDAGTCRLMHEAVFPNQATTPHEWDLLEIDNPFTSFAKRSRDPHFLAHRLSDVSTRVFGQAHSGAVERLLPYGVQMRLPGEGRSHWTLELERSGSNYSDRELLLLDAIRPALLTYESHRALVGVVAALKELQHTTASARTLSPRENEVLDLVGAGASNAEIAERLWISPATVKKHLENVYGKLEVGSRTAALARTGRSLAAGEATEQPPQLN